MEKRYSNILSKCINFVFCNNLQNDHQRQLAKENQAMKNQRSARTRTLIQLGGLVDKVGLTKVFDIALGCDLQLDTDEKGKAAMLLGFLHKALTELGNKTVHTDQRQELKKIGLKVLHRSL